MTDAARVGSPLAGTERPVPVVGSLAMRYLCFDDFLALVSAESSLSVEGRLDPYVKENEVYPMSGVRVAWMALLCIMCFMLVSCAAGPNSATQVGASHSAGFWFGVWHGMICPIAFIVSLFNKNVGIYEVHNNGAWYNLGFILGIGILSSVVNAPKYAGRRQQ